MTCQHLPLARGRKVWKMAGQKQFSLWAHWGEFALCCHSEGIECDVSGERSSSCVLHPQAAPEPHEGTSGLCVCVFWLSAKPEVKCFYSCVPSLCALLSDPALPGNNTKKNINQKTNKHFRADCLSHLAPAWHVLSKTLCLKDPFHCCHLTLKLPISCKKEDSQGKIFLPLQTLNLS